jgi:hypothetical protein
LTVHYYHTHMIEYHRHQQKLVVVGIIDGILSE